MTSWHCSWNSLEHDIPQFLEIRNKFETLHQIKRKQWRGFLHFCLGIGEAFSDLTRSPRMQVWTQTQFCQMQLKTLLRDKHTRLTQDLQQKALWGASYMALLFSFWATSRGSRLMIKTLLHWCRSFAVIPIATGLWFQLPYQQFNPKLTSLRRRFLFGQALKAQWCIDGIHLFSVHLER